MKPINWGVLSTAKIGVEKVIPAMANSQFGKVRAIASRQESAAKQAAQALNIEKAYGSYEDLLADPTLDAIYIPLPNHLHVPWSLKCLEAGKHVLCEKPLADNTTDIKTLIQAQRKTSLLVGEAFMIKHHPQWQAALNLIKKGALGAVTNIVGTFFYHNIDAQNIRNQAHALGGALMDIGCYPITVARMVFGAEPTSVCGHIRQSPEFKTDTHTSAILDFPQGQAIFSVGTQNVANQRISIIGTQKRLEISIPFNAPPLGNTTLELFGPDILSPSQERKIFEPVDQYTQQADDFAAAILSGGKPATSLEDSFYNAAIIEALFESARTHTWQTPKRLS